MIILGSFALLYVLFVIHMCMTSHMMPEEENVETLPCSSSSSDDDVDQVLCYPIGSRQPSRFE